MAARQIRLSLDVDSPDQIATVLYEAAQEYFDASEEMSASWQSEAAGRPWYKAAVILQRAADQIAKIDY